MAESDSDDGFGKCPSLGLSQWAADSGKSDHAQYSKKFLNYIKPFKTEARVTATNSVDDFQLAARVNTLCSDCERAAASNQLLFPWEVPGDMNPLASISLWIPLDAHLEHGGWKVHPISVDSVLPAQTQLKLDSAHVFAGVVCRAKSITWPEQLASRRDRAILRWRFMAEENLGASKIGRLIQEAVLDMRSETAIKKMLEDCFGGKNTNTLDKRGRSLSSYCKWHRTQFGTSALPVQERRVYDYVSELKDKAAKPTVAAGLISALNFAGHGFGFTGAVEAAESPRVKGSAFVQFSLKRPLCQKRVLVTDEVRILENLTVNGAEVRDRVGSGFFTAQLHGRGRFSDLQFSSELILDVGSDGGGFIEFRTLQCKTSSSREARTTFMPLVAIATGVLGTAWAKSWVKDLLEENLLECVHGSDNSYKFAKGFILPETLSNGEWGSHPISSATASKWLRSLLQLGGAVGVTDSVATHSLKSTPLSWCWKYGLSVTDCKMLGHHSLGQHKSSLTYSRDAQARSLRRYQSIVQAIREGSFDPDESRSGRFRQVLKRPRTEVGPLGSCNDAPVVVDLVDDGYSLVAQECSTVNSDCPGLPQDNSVDSNLPGIENEAHDIIPSDEPENLASSDSSDNSSSSSEDSDTSLPELPCVVAKGRKAFDTVSSLPVDDRLYMHVSSEIVHCRQHCEVEKLRCGRKLNVTFRRLLPPFEENMFRKFLLCKQCF